MLDYRTRQSLQVIGQVVSPGWRDDDTTTACGLIVKNPFFENKSAIPQGKLKYSPFPFLNAPEYPVCAMADWHDVGDVIDHYRLIRLEAMQIGEVVIAHPVCTWDNILERQIAIKEESAEERLLSIIKLAKLHGAKLSASEKRLLQKKSRKKKVNP